MPKPPKSSPNKKAVEDVISEFPFGKLVLGFFVREGKAVKEGWLAFLVIAAVSVWLGYDQRGKSDEVETAKVRHELDDTKRDRDKFQIQMVQAQDALAPWKELANSQYPGEPINKSLNLLLQKVDALQKVMQNAATDPLQEPIAAATATATVDVITDKPDPVGNNMGQGGVIVIAARNSALLAAGTINDTSFKTDPGQGKYRIVGTSAIDDAYMGRPITKLQDASYIVVFFAKGLVPPGTKVLGGDITWVINNRVTLKFKIPPQIALKHQADPNVSVVAVTNIESGLQALRR